MLEKNNVITPNAIKEAFENLPHNFAVRAMAVLEKWKLDGKIEKTYSKVYILKVKKGEEGAFNADIMNALVEVGLKNKEQKERFGITKKASEEN
jgi:hypothetical protein